MNSSVAVLELVRIRMREGCRRDDQVSGGFHANEERAHSCSGSRVAMMPLVAAGMRSSPPRRRSGSERTRTRPCRRPSPPLSAGTGDPGSRTGPRRRSKTTASIRLRDCSRKLKFHVKVVVASHRRVGNTASRVNHLHRVECPMNFKCRAFQ